MVYLQRVSQWHGKRIVQLEDLFIRLTVSIYTQLLVFAYYSKFSKTNFQHGISRQA